MSDYSFGPPKPWAAAWDGQTWQVQSTPNPAWSAWLSGVSCWSVRACIAVGGYFGTEGPTLTLAEQRNGTTWSVQATPNPASGAGLSGVSCDWPGVCMAVGGDSAGRTLAELYK